MLFGPSLERSVADVAAHRRILGGLLLGLVACSAESGTSSDALLIAHRGASAYAPEHTMAAYRLALDMGADYIEPDLQITSDGQLIALHDETLERTTNVRDVFPDRFREDVVRGQTVQRWHAVDFTLEEIRSLDAGSWFGAEHAGERVPTFAEVIELARGRAGIIPETKSPDAYRELGLSMERLVLADLQRFGLERHGADPTTPVVIQSFSRASLEIFEHELGSDLPLVFLLSGGEQSERLLTTEGLDEIRGFATGIGPTKRLLLEDPAAVERAHAVGLTVIPYTFSGDSPGSFPDVTAEMAHFVFELGVDGLFTDNPDLFPK
jgi:glycerophosphoryl diester phosphodiesterase